MTIALIGTSTINLPDDLKMDPPPWSQQPVQAVVSVSRGMNQIRWERALQYVPFNLVGGDDFGWIVESTLAALWATIIPEAEYTLNYHGTQMTVCWRNEEPPVIEYDDIDDYSTADDADRRNGIVLKFVRKLS